MLSPSTLLSSNNENIVLPHFPDANDSPSSTQFSPSNRVANASSQHIDSQKENQPDQSHSAGETKPVAPQKRLRKSSSAIFEEEPSFNEIYDRIDKYFDKEKLFYICPTPIDSHKNVLTLKACPKLERPSTESTSTEASTNPGSLNLDTLTCKKNLAMPSFLAKRGSLQKTKSERCMVSSQRAKTCGIFTDGSEMEKSTFAKFNFLNLTTAEERSPSPCAKSKERHLSDI
jgi:hypothetical protein